MLVGAGVMRMFSVSWSGRFQSVWLMLVVGIIQGQHASGQSLPESGPVGAVFPGIDQLIQQDFQPVTGLRVGLITNHTGLTREGVSTIDVLHHTDHCKLVCLLSPEHGIRGTADEKVKSSTDTSTGLPIHSLYGETQKPQPGMLQGLDALVFDIQDIGTRFYTYIGTMALCMKAAKEQGLRFVVLDRPNPIGGTKVEGAIPPPGQCGGLTSIYPIPTRHGMTVGELARLFNEHFGIGCRLEVVKMNGWRRPMYYDQTGLPWVNPSPNMKTLPGAILYPGLGICEATNLSVGRGTDQPFEMYGAPWLDAETICKDLNSRDIAGIHFDPVEFTPKTPSRPYKDEVCHGVKAVILDREALESSLAGLHLVQAIATAHHAEFKSRGGFETLSGAPGLWKMLIEEKRSPEEILESWKAALDEFCKVRERFLLY